MLLMVSSILTPGTIFLMILGAINMAYPQISLYWALVLNMAPIAVFILLCYVSKSNIQVCKNVHLTSSLDNSQSEKNIFNNFTRVVLSSSNLCVYFSQ